MFSANEALTLRQHKRKIVNWIEDTMPEEALDFGTSVMVMQVTCKDPGCVPIETSVIIIFPRSDDGEELIPGLPESGIGGSYKTQILKPMADVTQDDVLDHLPPCFEGGRRTMEKVCLYARDVMIGQITQLFGDGNDEQNFNENKDNPTPSSAHKDRIAMANYLQLCLQEYIANGCKPPPFGEPFPNKNPTFGDSAEATASVAAAAAADDDDNKSSLEDPSETNETKSSTITIVDAATSNTSATTAINASVATTTTKSAILQSKGNVMIRRRNDRDERTTTTVAPAVARNNYGTGGSTVTSIRARQPPRHERAIQQALGSQQLSSSTMNSTSSVSRLFSREHAPGIRKPGCPCCDVENPSVLADKFLMM